MINQPDDSNGLITEDWLKLIGFKWHQLDRQPEKHWLLWLGECLGKHTSFEDFGIELSSSRGDDEWFCWLRADYSGRYSRFIHVRHLRYRRELIRLIEGLIDDTFTPENSLGGNLRPEAIAQRLRAESERLELQWLRQNPAWHETEADESRGRALPEHAQELHDLKKGTGHD